MYTYIRICVCICMHIFIFYLVGKHHTMASRNTHTATKTNKHYSHNQGICGR